MRRTRDVFWDLAFVFLLFWTLLLSGSGGLSSSSIFSSTFPSLSSFRMPNDSHNADDLANRDRSDEGQRRRSLGEDEDFDGKEVARKLYAPPETENDGEGRASTTD